MLSGCQSCQSSLTVDFDDDDASPTLDPEPNQPSPRFAEHEPEPTADGEPEPAAPDELSPNGAAVLRIAPEPEPEPEPEPITSNQVQEPSHVMVEVTVEREGAGESTAPLLRVSGNWIWDCSIFNRI
ncbi:Repellent protein 1 [Labeo rohita]|uniref:Repellent protein 1 n=1 Tax=Labeo rohita TaxID=84645 RepID=A0ABQ8LEH3_LABRO|nr:Repellent protein 1 [Labeo rohita]